MFIHLHTHSHYSLLDGLGKIDDLIEQAKKYKMPALALTDHGVLYGAIEFYQKATQAKIKPIIGAEVYVAPFKHTDRKKTNEKPYHLVLLAKDYNGYKNLIKLVTIAHLEGFYRKPRIDDSLLKKYSQGLIALSACDQGKIPRLIIEKKLKQAEQTALFYKEIFNNNFYLELQDRPENEDRKIINKQLIKLSKKLNIPLVATNDIHYISKEDRDVHDILLCLQTKKKKDDKNRLKIESDLSFTSPQEMEKKFKNIPEAIKNTQKIADLCNLKIEFGKTTLPYFKTPENKTPDEYLKELCLKNLPKRYSKKRKEVIERLNYELEIIKKTKFSSYFLIVQDLVNWAKNQGIVVGPGRGSAASSIVSYLLNITNVDPLKYGLIFERFLNPERISMPDIDLDFADTRRDEVVRYIEKKYGKKQVAGIITFGTMAARVAVRDVGRVLGFPYSFCDQLAKTIPQNFSLEQALEKTQELKDFIASNKDAKKIIDIALKLEGVVRHSSRHACGIVIAPKELTEYTPLQYDVSGKEKSIISQYEMHAIESLGLLKMDLLGLKNLTLLETAIKLIKKTRNVDIKLEEIPLTDKKTFRLLQKGETIGCFQLESSGMRSYLRELKPTNFEDIIAMVALYRPGPMRLIKNYIDGKHKKKKPTYLHPKLRPILEKTYGVCVYQEQVLQIAKDLAGFSLGESDILRKAVGKKIPKLLQEQKDKFIQGCLKNKISRKIAEQIFSFIEPFAGYAFNRSHATCYAMIAYQTAYLKANYPEEFMAALLTSDQNDTDRINIEIEEARKMNIEILKPDINESFESFSPQKNKIRFGLLAIKNVGKPIVEEIITEREKNGPFKSLEDFLTRIHSRHLNKKSLESLIKAGALDSLGDRGAMLASLDLLLNFAKQQQKDKHNGQSTLFSISKTNNLSLKLKKPLNISTCQELFWEKELLGIFISSHPLKEYEKIIKRYVTPVKNIKPNSFNKILTVIEKIEKKSTTNGQTMLFVEVSDFSGQIEIIVFPSVYQATKNIWQEGNIIFVQGRASFNRDGKINLIVEQAKKVEKEKLDELVLQ